MDLIEKYLGESAIKKVHIHVQNIPMLHSELKKLSEKNNFAWVAAVVFGLAYINAYASPSKIPYNAVGDSPSEFKGYYQKGVFKKFSEKLIVRYQQSAEGADR
jgi:hypothetical protein